MDIVQNCKAGKRQIEYSSKEQTHSGLVQGMCPLVTLWQLHLTEEDVRISGAIYHNKSCPTKINLQPSITTDEEYPGVQR